MASAASFGLHLVLLFGLAVVAVAFWTLLLAAAAGRQWGSVGVLLVTGKLACLLGALMIFATRDLYLLPGLSIPFCSTGPSTLADQHLAGLLMITACPLSYLVAGAVLTAQMIGRTDKDPKPGYRGLATG
jgi:putative membrane protein